MIKKALIALVLALLLAVIGLTIAATVGQFALWGGTPRVESIAVGIGLGLLVVPTLRMSRRIANRLVYGRRSTPYEVLSTFSSRVGETYSIDDVLPRMAQILAEATGADVARVWLGVGGTLRHEASWPADAPAPPALPMSPDRLPEVAGESAFEVRDHGELLGALSVQMPASDPMDPVEGTARRRPRVAGRPGAPQRATDRGAPRVAGSAWSPRRTRSVARSNGTSTTAPSSSWSRSRCSSSWRGPCSTETPRRPASSWRDCR